MGNLYWLNSLVIECGGLPCYSQISIRKSPSTLFSRVLFCLPCDGDEMGTPHGNAHVRVEGMRRGAGERFRIAIAGELQNF